MLHRIVFLGLAFLTMAMDAHAVITAKVPLKDVITHEEQILTAHVISQDRDNRQVSIQVLEPLKGKATFTTLTVDLTGDADAKRLGHVPILLDRLTKNRRLILFISPQKQGHSAFVFVEGSWFQMRGQRVGDAWQWRLLHGEPYLRRTFKSTTAELEMLIRDVLAGKRSAPPVDEKEPPGFGPPGEPDKDHSPALFAVLPSFVLVGPLAVLAAIFPGLAGTVAVLSRRWRAFLVTCTVSTSLALSHFLARDSLPDLAWFRPFNVLLVLTFLHLGGFLWAARRQPFLPPPADVEVVALPIAGGFGTLALLGLMYFVSFAELARLPWVTLVALTAGLLGAALIRVIRGRVNERIALLISAFVLLLVIGVNRPRSFPRTDANAAVEILYESSDYDGILSGLTLAGETLYFGTKKQSGFRASGAVVALDLTTGRERWRFDHAGELRPVFATPVVENGSLFVGEGLHSDSDCHVFRLNLQNGTSIWNQPYSTQGHVEGAMAVTNGRIYAPAGGDGLHAIDVETGTRLWQQTGPGWHVDTPPVFANGRLFAGSGYATKALLCLDGQTGQRIWDVPIALRSFGRPAYNGEYLFFGLGTGTLSSDRVNEPDEPEIASGAIVCLNAETGSIIWRRDLPKPVHAPVAVHSELVYATSRNGVLYALSQKSGEILWQCTLGEESLGGPNLMGETVVIVTRAGRVLEIDSRRGQFLRMIDLASLLGRSVEAYGQPVRFQDRLLIGCGLSDPVGSTHSIAIVAVR